MKKFYVSTAIPYVNSKPHVGFALELVQADAIARYHRLLGEEVFFQTGTDDNAFKNVQSAKAAGVPTASFVEANAAAFRELAVALDISFDRFVRTAAAPHREAVHKFWDALSPGDLRLERYQGLYCVGCEDFLLEGNLSGGLCPEHRVRPEPVAEENFFFRLSAYQGRLRQLVADGAVEIVPATRRREVLGFIDQGLRDISVSRAAGRAGDWGIDVPGHPAQVVYVWIDALVNYLSGGGPWEEAAERVHVIGKNVLKFHAVYWPALLLSVGLPPPSKIVAHGFLTVGGEKISKSGGNAVDPLPLVKSHGADALRYYLLRRFSPFDDGDFSLEDFASAYHSDLASGIGNLVSRLLKLCELARFAEFIPPPGTPPAPDGYHQASRNHEHNLALRALWRGVAELNVAINAAKPWEAVKAGDAAGLKPRLAEWLEALHALAHWLSPFLPGAARKIQEALAARPLRADGQLFPKHLALV